MESYFVERWGDSLAVLSNEINQDGENVIAAIVSSECGQLTVKIFDYSDELWSTVSELVVKFKGKHQNI